MIGKQIIANFYHAPAALLNDPLWLKEQFVAASQQAGATVIDVAFHHFSPQGVSGIVVLQESHLAIHSWPELGYAAIDIFTCGEQISPLQMMEFLTGQLQPQKTDIQSLPRGEGLELPPDRDLIEQRKTMESVWLTERYHEIAFSVKVKGEVLFREQSPYQMVEVMDTDQFGRVLVTDGWITWSETAQNSVHEAMVHVPLLSQGTRTAQVTVLGGGDGGLLRELLRYPSLQNICMVERDEAVLSAVRQFFPKNEAALQNALVESVQEDVFEHLRKCGPSSTLFLCDFLLSPVIPANDDDFLQLANGIASTVHQWVIPLGNPYVQEKEVFGRIGTLKKELPPTHDLHIFGCHGHSFMSGYWLTALVFPTSSPLQFDASRWGAVGQKESLRYFHPGMWQSAFALPQQFRVLLGEQ